MQVITEIQVWKRKEQPVEGLPAKVVSEWEWMPDLEDMTEYLKKKYRADADTFEMYRPEDAG